MKIEWNRVTWYSKLAAVIVFLVVLILGVFIGIQYEKLQFYNNSGKFETYENEDLKYKNQIYGFSLNLPKSWKGYIVASSSVKSFDGKVVYGEVIIIRSPKWTPENPTMDIPIQIFTIEQWNKWVATDFNGYPTAAPIWPTERGHNSKFVFATEPRYNYSYLPGFEEVEDIIKNLKTQ